MHRNKPWIFFNKSAEISRSHFYLNLWQDKFANLSHNCLVDESIDSFNENKIHTSISRVVSSKDASMFNFVCSFHFGESKFPKESFEFCRINDIKRICVLTHSRISEKLYNEILLGFFDFILIDEIGDHFGLTNLVRNINPFMKIFIYKNGTLDLLDSSQNTYNIIAEESLKNNIIIKHQFNHFISNGIACSMEYLEKYPVFKSHNGWIVLPQMRDNLEIIRNSFVLYSCGEKVFIPQEIFDNFHYGIPYKSFKEIKDLSIYDKSDKKCIFECLESSDFVIKILAIIHGS